MPPPLNTQNVIALIWDFDKTLTTKYMQAPLFDHFGIDERIFWEEVNGLVDHYAKRDLLVNKDTTYLGHMLTYVEHGKFPGLTNELLRELGAQIELAPGMPDFMQRSKQVVLDDPRFQHAGIQVEHYIVSTGLRQMIIGSQINEQVDHIWACELLTDPPGPGLVGQEQDQLTRVVSQLGYVIDNTTKTRAIFEINKGVNHDPEIDVNALMDEGARRVPFANMIYVADGPSDVPVFSLINKNGGKTLGVWTTGGRSNFEQVKMLEDQGRVNHMGEADYTENKATDLWLMSSIKQIANRICEQRTRLLLDIPGAPGHVV